MKRESPQNNKFDFFFSQYTIARQINDKVEKVFYVMCFRTSSDWSNVFADVIIIYAYKGYGEYENVNVDHNYE